MIHGLVFNSLGLTLKISFCIIKLCSDALARLLTMIRASFISFLNVAAIFYRKKNFFFEVKMLVWYCQFNVVLEM